MPPLAPIVADCCDADFDEDPTSPPSTAALRLEGELVFFPLPLPLSPVHIYQICNDGKENRYRPVGLVDLEPTGVGFAVPAGLNRSAGGTQAGAISAA